MKRIARLSCLFSWCSITTLSAFSGNNISLGLDQIFLEYQFYSNHIEGMRSMSDGENFTMLERGRSIVTYDYNSGKAGNVLFSVDQVREPVFSHIDDYELNGDESKILLTTDRSSLNRNTFEARYYVYDRAAKTTEPLTEKGKQRLASFSPDGRLVAFVKENNLFYKNLIDHTVTQITTDGVLNRIINGAPDWVYEEEFTLTLTFCWSPDSRKIAFYRFDESLVPEFDMTLFYDLYPQTYRFKYPKAGEKNSVVGIRVFDIPGGKTSSMDVGPETDQYIPRIKWTSSNDTVCIVRLNRLQNKVDVLLASAQTGKSHVIFTETNNRFIPQINDDYINFTPDGREFIIRSERSGYFHYYLYSVSGTLLNAITQGDWEVGTLEGIDYKRKILYYSSTEESPIRRNVYSVKFDGSHKTGLCLQTGTNSVAFSSTFKYYVNTWSDANTPPRFTLHKINGTLLRVLEDNDALKKKIRVFGFTEKKFIRVPVKNDLLNAYLILPPGFDSTQVYPLFISVYGGPEEQSVTDNWDDNIAWQQYLSQRGIIVACIDNRGTDGRGEEFRKCTYMQLGMLETEDQLAAATYLGSKKWIDENRIGIWGWSYGGYMTLLCMTKGAGIYKMGIAVAPVTNWRFYDTIYTERFLRTPRENPGGYDLGSPMHYASRLKGKLLLVHGTGDDNVHFQNSAEFVEQLIRDNKQFETFYYPNKNHNIAGGNTRYHLYTMLSRFVEENLLEN